MSKRQQRQDHYSGIPWVHVSPEEVRNHPKGQLTALLWAIGLYFIVTALLKMGLYRSEGAGFGWALFLGLWPLLTGIGLLIRAPWALILAVISAGLSAYTLIRGMDVLSQVAATGSVYFEGDRFLIAPLVELLISVGILFHLMDGDRPNFIYRHRYRKYSVLNEDNNDAG